MTAPRWPAGAAAARAQGGRAPGSGARGGHAQGGGTQGNPAQGNPAQGGPAQGGPAQGGPAQGGPALGGPAQGGAAQGGAAQGNPAQGNRAAGGGARTAPVIVLTYPHAGANRLRALLADRPDLICTAGTGLLPACDLAVAAWRHAERGRDGSMSALAAGSVRALATGMITSIVARAGRPRWCETAVADRGAAETFLRLFPATRFLCLHRSCPDVVYAALRANPWGLAGPGFAAYTAAYPGSTLAALAAWWAGQAGPALAFEEAHPGECLRVRYEDLVAHERRTAARVDELLGPCGPAGGLSGPMGGPMGGGEDEREEARAARGADAPGCGADFPSGQLPAPLLAQINALHARLDYPPLPSVPAGS